MYCLRQEHPAHINFVSTQPAHINFEGQPAQNPFKKTHPAFLDIRLKKNTERFFFFLKGQVPGQVPSGLLTKENKTTG